jgi:homoserine kinase
MTNSTHDVDFRDQWFEAFAPATVANVGPGFDILGLAIAESVGLGDHCAVRLSAGSGTELSILGDGGKLPADPEMNVATVAARHLLSAANWHGKLEVRLTKGLPLGSGLGSSAASAAACLRAVVAAYSATQSSESIPIREEWVLAAGREGERLAAGSPHPDNVVPSLLGGFRLMFDTDAGFINESLPVPDWLRVVVAIPELEVRTADARAVMPAQVPMGDAVANAAHVGLLVSALFNGDKITLSRAIHDRLHQPYRVPLVRGFETARERALQRHAIAVGLSGSGPAVFAFATNETAPAVGTALVDGFAASGVKARTAHGPIEPSRSLLS